MRFPRNRVPCHSYGSRGTRSQRVPGSSGTGTSGLHRFPRNQAGVTWPRFLRNRTMGCRAVPTEPIFSRQFRFRGNQPGRVVSVPGEPGPTHGSGSSGTGAASPAVIAVLPEPVPRLCSGSHGTDRASVVVAIPCYCARGARSTAAQAAEVVFSVPVASRSNPALCRPRFPSAPAVLTEPPRCRETGGGPASVAGEIWATSQDLSPPYSVPYSVRRPGNNAGPENNHEHAGPDHRPSPNTASVPALKVRTSGLARPLGEKANVACGENRRPCGPGRSHI